MGIILLKKKGSKVLMDLLNELGQMCFKLYSRLELSTKEKVLSRILLKLGFNSNIIKVGGNSWAE